MRPGAALVSIHDVMPATLDRVGELLALAEAAGVARLTLLVVPGGPWTPAGLARVRAWSEAGHELAGHGWTHRARSIRGLRHRLHSLFVSRDCAEHLALGGPEILALMRRCRAWFAAQGLPTPSLYVPPAWALGPVAPAELAVSGFERVETLAGVRELAGGRFARLPLLGFEARDRWQVPVLRASNALNAAIAGGGLRRVAIHPDDHRLPLRGALERALSTCARAHLYRELPALAG